MRKAVQYLVVLVVLVIVGSFAVPSVATAAPPAASAKIDLPKTALVCINYWPDGQYLGVRFKLIPVGSSPEVYEAVNRATLIEIAAEHGRQDLVDTLMRDGVQITDKATFKAEAGFDPDTLFSAYLAGVSTASPEVSLVSDPGFSTDSGRRRPPRRPIPCICSSLICDFTTCGKHYCSGGCGGCNLCG